jgi:hypothetical protein
MQKNVSSSGHAERNPRPGKDKSPGRRDMILLETFVPMALTASFQNRHRTGTFSVAMQPKSHGQIALPHFWAGRINGPDGFYSLAVF